MFGSIVKSKEQGGASNSHDMIIQESGTMAPPKNQGFSKPKKVAPSISTVYIVHEFDQSLSHFCYIYHLSLSLYYIIKFYFGLRFR